jgi:hypothetical protein
MIATAKVWNQTYQDRAWSDGVGSIAVIDSTGNMTKKLGVNPNTIASVNSAGSDIEYRSLTPGGNVIITYSANTINIDAIISGGGATTFNTTLQGLSPASPTSGSVTLSGTLGAASGGTGQTTYNTGDILYASAPNTLSRLPSSTQNNVLIVGPGSSPAWMTHHTISTGRVTLIGGASGGVIPQVFEYMGIYDNLSGAKSLTFWPVTSGVVNTSVVGADMYLRFSYVMTNGNPLPNTPTFYPSNYLNSGLGLIMGNGHHTTGWTSFQSFNDMWRSFLVLYYDGGTSNFEWCITRPNNVNSFFASFNAMFSSYTTGWYI